eukprot:267395_1
MSQIMHTSLLILLFILCSYHSIKSDSVSTSGNDNNKEEQQPDSTQQTDESLQEEPTKDRNGIWQLSDQQFDPFLESHESVTVLFTRADDLYSYAGKYHFDRAAHILRDLRNSTTQFAEIEGDRKLSKIHDEFGIEYYPSVKYCHHDYLSPLLETTKNKTTTNTQIQPEQDEHWEIRCLDYNHHVVELMLVKWVEGLNNQCSLTILNIDSFEQAKKEHDILFVGFFDDINSLQFKLFEDICKQYKWERDIWSYQPTFAVVLNKQFAKTLSENIPGLIAYCEFKEHAWIYNGPMIDRGAIRSFIETERYPYFTQITAFNFKQYTEELDIPLLWVAIDDEYESYVKRVGRMYEKLGIEFKGYVAIIWISSQSYMGHIRKLGFPFVPGAMFIDTKNNYKQLYDPNASILNYDKVKLWIQSCFDGSGTLFIKSQDEQDMVRMIENDKKEFNKQNILIKHVNGNELHQILEGDEVTYGKYNVIVFYYAVWDNRCQKFHPIYERIAELLLNSNGSVMYDDLLLVKIDGEHNDVHVKIDSYPKIYLYRNKIWPKTSEKDNWIVYGRRRDEKSFIKWLRLKCEYDEMGSIGVDVDGQQQVDMNDNEENEPFEYQ